MVNSSPVEVDVWSDLACPWCYIGKRRLEAAITKLDLEVIVRFHSYELQPDFVPVPGSREIDMLAEKMGGRANAERAFEHVSALAAAEGLNYQFDDVIPANTFDAHRLTHLAKRHDLEDAIVERLFSAHFIEGLDIGDHEVLVGLAVEVGVDADAARGVLASGEFGDEVRGDEKTAGELGVTGVPFFVLEGAYGISGAQPVEVFVEAFGRVLADRDVS